MSDQDAFEYYLDPEHQRLKGTPRRRPTGGVLTEHVPIRFRPDVIARVRTLAEREGTTVSTWIRRVVEAAVDRQMPPVPETGPSGPRSGRWTSLSEGASGVSTTSPRNLVDA